MFPYNYNTARLIHKYKHIGGNTSEDFNEYLKSKIDCCDEYIKNDYRVTLYDHQSVNVNSSNFNGMLLVADRGAGKDYTIVGALLEFVCNSPNSSVALFSFENRGDQFKRLSTLKALRQLCPEDISFEIDANLITFCNGSTVELFYCLVGIKDLANYWKPAMYDLVLVNESKFQNGLDLDSINKISNGKWVCAGTYESPLENLFVKECIHSDCDVRFAVVQDNKALPVSYISEVEKTYGLFSNPKV